MKNVSIYIPSICNEPCDKISKQQIHYELITKYRFQPVFHKIKNYLDTANDIHKYASTGDTDRWISTITQLMLYMEDHFAVIVWSEEHDDRLTKKSTIYVLYKQVEHLHKDFYMNAKFVFLENKVLQEKVETAKAALISLRHVIIHYYVSPLRILKKYLINDVLNAVFEYMYGENFVHPLEVINAIEMD